MPEETELLRLSADIVAAHLRHNSVPTDAVPDVIRSVYAALRNVGTAEPVVAPQEPAVPIKRSVFPDYIVCLEDGKKLKMLKRHLQATFGLSPDEYRAKWGLPSNYPMVAPNYAARRSNLAKEIGLGRRSAEEDAAEIPVQRIPEGRSGRKPKAKQHADVER